MEGGAEFFADVPSNAGELMSELAHAYHWPPSELDALTAPELLYWHRGLAKLQERLKES